MFNRLRRPPEQGPPSGRGGARRSPPFGYRRSSDAENASASADARARQSPGLRRGRTRGNRTAEILTISVLVALLVLFGVGMMLWAVQTQVALSPTPTPTATPRAPATATPDVRATLVAEDIAAQIAMVHVLQTRIAEGFVPEPNDLLPDPEFDETTLLPDIGVVGPALDDPAPDETETVDTMVTPAVPDVDGDDPVPTGTLTPVTLIVPFVEMVPEEPAPTATATEMPTEIPTEIPTDIPTDTPEPVVEPATPIPTEPVPTETATPEPPTPLPVDAATPTPTSTPPLFTVPSLQASIQPFDTVGRIGPSNVYTATSSFAANSPVNLRGRDATGDWVYACCTVANESAWIRQAFARPVGNDLGPGAPEGAVADDVRWLGIQALPANLPPRAVPTAIPAGDYPLYRYNRANQGLVGDAPNPPVVFAWRGTAAQALISPVGVVGNSVLVSSADNHIYSFDRVNGNQRWRYSVGRFSRLAPAVQDNVIYLALEDGVVLALLDQGNQATELWRATLPGPPVSPFNISGRALFIAVGQPDNFELITLDRENGGLLRSLPISGPRLSYPAIGDQLLFVGGEALIALDATLATPNAYEIVWTRDDIAGITTPPLYSDRGVRTVAELYVVDENNRVHSLEANTGRELWTANNGEPATGLAVNQGALFVSGDGYVKALSRQNGAQLWRATVPGPILGGPIVDNEYVIIVTQVGIMQFLSAVTGNSAGGSSIPASTGGSPAVSHPYIFIPGADGLLYALQGSP